MIMITPWVLVAATTPFGVSYEVREYLPLVLLVVVGVLTGLLWLKIKKHV